MSLSISIASSRVRSQGPRKYMGSITAPNHKGDRSTSTSSTGSGNMKQQSSNSEEEIAHRQQRNRQNSAKTSCCLISLLCHASLPVSVNTVIVALTVVCLSWISDMAAT